ncbi:hypothetical protein FKM82_029982 [Ascaphus truei]
MSPALSWRVCGHLGFHGCRGSVSPVLPHTCRSFFSPPCGLTGCGSLLSLVLSLPLASACTSPGIGSVFPYTPGFRSQAKVGVPTPYLCPVGLYPVLQSEVLHIARVMQWTPRDRENHPPLPSCIVQRFLLKRGALLCP